MNQCSEQILSNKSHKGVTLGTNRMRMNDTQDAKMKPSPFNFFYRPIVGVSKTSLFQV